VGAVGPLTVVVDPPGLQEDLGLQDAGEELAVEVLVSQASVERLDPGVLPGAPDRVALSGAELRRCLPGGVGMVQVFDRWLYVHFAKSPLTGRWLLPLSKLSPEQLARSWNAGAVHDQRFPEQVRRDRVYAPLPTRDHDIQHRDGLRRARLVALPGAADRPPRARSRKRWPLPHLPDVLACPDRALHRPTQRQSHQWRRAAVRRCEY
jgi:hypothetical protein